MLGAAVALPLEFGLTPLPALSVEMGDLAYHFAMNGDLSEAIRGAAATARRVTFVRDDLSAAPSFNPVRTCMIK